MARLEVSLHPESRRRDVGLGLRRDRAARRAVDRDQARSRPGEGAGERRGISKAVIPSGLTGVVIPSREATQDDRGSVAWLKRATANSIPRRSGQPSSSCAIAFESAFLIRASAVSPRSSRTLRSRTKSLSCNFVSRSGGCAPQQWLRWSRSWRWCCGLWCT